MIIKNIKSMRIKKVNEFYESKPKENWGPEGNYYTFTCDITVKASSLENAEDKMEFIANGSEDIVLGLYTLSHSTENGEPKVNKTYTTSSNIPEKNMLESKSRHRTKKRI